MSFYLVVLNCIQFTPVVAAACPDLTIVPGNFDSGFGMISGEYCTKIGFKAWV
ncbi:hypothetical protein [Agarilytica rhodophyticola]|uniref:hypothetical protein n=1 Tax=Agarilytica rhodophyticola TaxID=1737490 RepID=UPI001315689C|nr:hypothetical protein [Agarilytica rhodophyticola]